MILKETNFCLSFQLLTFRIHEGDELNFMLHNLKNLDNKLFKVYSQYHFLCHDNTWCRWKLQTCCIVALITIKFNNGLTSKWYAWNKNFKTSGFSLQSCLWARLFKIQSKTSSLFVSRLGSFHFILNNRKFPNLKIFIVSKSTETYELAVFGALRQKFGLK